MRRMIYPYQWERSDLSGEYITYGQYYFIDDETGKIISQQEYIDLKKQQRLAEWDFTRLENVQSVTEYRQAMLAKQDEELIKHLANTKLDKGGYTVVRND